ncbi:hypothetical protein Desaf_2873 [Desulfocurvibacter africanus subsp. africanus str. Walvis Bay]|uniref:Uncharacterized protein n=2 Tax=Desulfocurvibacter africanus TaxID=873 RepID=F3Z1Q0_DESAF|nr:hypothetical protein Desaf_2873 [Desulfocurvibacter africanus subsp. africanus str. Walvis Bay]
MERRLAGLYACEPALPGVHMPSTEPVDLLSRITGAAPSLLRFTHAQPNQFEIILQAGFALPVERPTNVYEFLRDQLGVPEEVIQQRIQTLFLNSSPVDNLLTAQVRPGSTLALSGALPGLLGATMRRGGYYSRMREGISYKQDEPLTEEHAKPFLVQVRLYNLMARDLAGYALRRGILVPKDRLCEFLEQQPPAFWMQFGQCELDEKPIPTDAFHQAAWEPCTETILLLLADSPVKE